MKRIFINMIFVVGAISLFGQQQIENPGFENWENAGTVADEPVDWSSIKTSDAGSLINSSAPQVWAQSTNAHSGTYCVQLTNVSAFSIVATGTMTNGRVHADFTPSNGYVFTDGTDARWNTPFTDHPDSLVGWYSYNPQGGDKGKVEAILHTGAAQIPENGTFANWVGQARFDLPSTTVGSWTRFSVPFLYYNSNTPQYILLVLAAGDSTIAIDGSVAYFDDLELIYNPASIIAESDLSNAQIYNNGTELHIVAQKVLKGTALQVFDICGKEVYSENLIYSENVIQIPIVRGIYIVKLSDGVKVVTKKIRVI